jgi:hypothetical protein
MRPDDIVGRHLRIKWAKGKFYPGTVASFNKETGKHQVRYADGDVKDYLLGKDYSDSKMMLDDLRFRQSSTWLAASFSQNTCLGNVTF